MGFDWQEVAALGLVVVAMGYLARSGYRLLSSRGASASGGCGSGCGACPSGPKAEQGDRGGPLVAIGPPRIGSHPDK